MQEGEEVGIHVAGYAPWVDNELRPFFYHIHNGHGKFITQHETDKYGALLAVHTKWVSDPRKLFEKHQDFPSDSRKNIKIFPQPTNLLMKTLKASKPVT